MANTEKQKITAKLILEILFFVASIIPYVVILDNYLEIMSGAFLSLGGGGHIRYALITVPESMLIVVAMLATALSIISLIIIIRTIVTTVRYGREYAKYSSGANKVKFVKIFSIITLTFAGLIYPLIWGSLFIEILRALKL